jgi:predicted DNA-binding transcriptional regulator AlpA
LAGPGVSTSTGSYPQVNLLTLDQVVDLTGLSRSSLAKKRCDGSGPAFFKIGRTVKYAASDVDAWILSRRRTSTWGANDNASKTEVAA